jgi:glycosyltransferase involved in cell wall biosynthesis
MKRVLFVQPSIQPPGGGNGVAAWMMEALKAENRVTLLTWARPRLDEVNRIFGTRLVSSDFQLRLGPQWVLAIMRLSPTPIDLLTSNLLSREARRIAPDFDVIISVNNEADLGGRGIQYVHFPKYRRERPTGDLRWFHLAPLVDLYYYAANHLTGFSADRMRANLTLVNSDYIGRFFAAEHGVESLTLNPPALGIFPETPWESREDGFVIIGRLSPEKRVERAIEILSRVRERFPSVHLHIAGSGHRPSYGAMVRRRVAENSSWVFLHQELSRAQLNELIAQHRYGIHAMEDEHFGMAVAELVSGGCIPIVPRGGGPPEIVGGDDRLLYSTEDEAVAKIERIISDPELSADLRRTLAPRRRLFSTGLFVQRMRKLVREFPNPGPFAEPGPD